MAEPRRNTNYTVIVHASNDADNGKPITVTAPLPPEFAFDLANSYEAPFAQGLVQDQNIRNAAAAFGMRAATPSMTAQIWQGTSEQDMSLELEFHTETDPLQDVRAPVISLLSLVTPGVNSTTNMLTSPGPRLEGSIEEIGKLAADIGGTLIGAITSAVSSATGVTPPKVVDKLQDPNQTTLAGNGGQAPTANPTPQGLGSSQFWKKRVKNQISIQIGNYAFFDSVVITDVSKTFVSNIDPTTGWPHHMRVSVRFRPLFCIVRDDLEQIFMVKPSASLGGAASGLLGLFI